MLRHLPFRALTRWLPPSGVAREKLFVTTTDGVRLAIHRVPPASGAPSEHPPVLLLHGLGANRSGFLVPQRSLAHHLSSLGFDCYVPELRGAGESEVPARPWDLDDYLEHDLPAILSAVRESSGHHEVHWVGHSMGGLLLCCYAILRSAEGDHGIRRGVTIGSALDYRVGQSGFARLFAVRRLIEKLPAVPFGPLAHALSPLMGRVRNPLEAFNFSFANVEPEIVRAWHGHGFEWIPTRLLSSLATTFEETGLRSRDGKIRYLDCVQQVRFPLLFVAGSSDVQCPVEAVEATARSVGPHARLLAFGRAFGHAEDYGHCDLIVGRNAPREVWPHLARFLAGED